MALLGDAAGSADIVVAIDRALTPGEAEQDGAAPYGVAEFAIAKHRRGFLQTVRLAFVPEYRKFFSYCEE